MVIAFKTEVEVSDGPVFDIIEFHIYIGEIRHTEEGFELDWFKCAIDLNEVEFRLTVSVRVY